MDVVATVAGRLAGVGLVPHTGAAVRGRDRFGDAAGVETKRTAVAMHTWYTAAERGCCKPRRPWRFDGRRQTGGEAAALSQRTWMGATRTTVRMKRPRRVVELVATLEKQNAGMVPRDGATGDPPDGTVDRPARLHAGMALGCRGAWLGQQRHAAVVACASRTPVFRLTLAFSGPAAPRHYETAHTTIGEHHGEPGSSRVRCNALLGRH